MTLTLEAVTISSSIYKKLQELESGSPWYRRVHEKIQMVMDLSDKRTVKKYKLDQFLRMARKIDSFSDVCEECQATKAGITRLADDIDAVIQTNDNEKSRIFQEDVNRFIKHLREKHKLVNKGYYTGIMGSIGAGIGTALGVAFSSVPYGSAIGIIGCILIGLLLDYKAQKDGRVI